MKAKGEQMERAIQSAGGAEPAPHAVPPKYATAEQMERLIEAIGGGASSLADLSDVDIQEGSVDNANLLRFDTGTEKWENVRVSRALFGYDYSDFPGVLTIDDSGGVGVFSGLRNDMSDEFGQIFSQLLQATLTYGQYQADDLNPRTFRPLVEESHDAIAYNANLSYLVISDYRLEHYFQLVGASKDFAVWSGVIINGVKFYRITFAVICPDNTTPASIVVKAEELMTFTEPT